MAGFLLDTNVISKLTRPRPHGGVLRFLDRESDLWLSAITMHELAYGAERADGAAKKARLEAWLAGVKAQFGPRVIAVTSADAELAGRLRAASELQGRECDALDALIAAAAISRGLTLVTRNIKDFQLSGAALLNPWKG